MQRYNEHKYWSLPILQIIRPLFRCSMTFVFLFSTAIVILIPLRFKYLRTSTVSVCMDLQPVVAFVVAVMEGQDDSSWGNRSLQSLWLQDLCCHTESSEEDELILSFYLIIYVSIITPFISLHRQVARLPQWYPWFPKRTKSLSLHGGTECQRKQQWAVRKLP